MTQIRWVPAMSVGVPALDSDHRCLIRIINLLDDATNSADAARAVDMVLETLVIYSQFHFNREQRVMNGINFPGRTFHAAEHGAFARFIRNLRDRHHLEGTPETARTLKDYLSNWLSHHILIQDMAFKPYVQDRTDVDGIVETATRNDPVMTAERLELV